MSLPDFETVPGTPGEKSQAVLQASATFAARSSSNQAVSVPPLLPDTPAEVALFERGKQAMAARRAEREHALDRVPPTVDELALVHNLFLEAGERAASAVGAGNVLYTEDTRVSSVDVTMPQRAYCSLPSRHRSDQSLCADPNILRRADRPQRTRQDLWRLADAPRI